jgi:hypothetical protein
VAPGARAPHRGVDETFDPAGDEHVAADGVGVLFVDSGPAGGGKASLMPTLADRFRRFLRSPQGQRLIVRAQEELRKPGNRRRLQQVVARVRRRG